MTATLIHPAKTIRRLQPANEVPRALPIFPLLSAILFVQVAVMVTLQNTAFQDESLYLYAGKDIINAWTTGKPITDTYGSYFSGLPYFWPVIAGFLDQIGGLQLARGLSMVSGLWLTLVVFFVGRRLFSDRVGLLGAAFFAVQAPVLFIGRLATYDVFSLALLGSALAIAASRPRWWKTVAIMALCSAAPVAKYATAIFVPSALLVCLALIFLQVGARPMLRQIVVAVISGAVFGALVVVVFRADPNVIAGLTSTTTARSPIDAVSRTVLLEESARVLGIFALLAVVGLVLVLRRRPGTVKVLVSILLALTVFIAPAYHVTTGELTSLDKHVAFGMLFGAPLVGYLFSRLVDSHLITHLQGLAVSVAVFLVIFGLNISVAQGLFTAWPNSTKMLTSLEELVRMNNTRVLAEEMEVPRYYLSGQDGISSYWQYTGFNYFQFKDPITGETLTGDPAYTAAIKNGYFQVVVVDYGPSAAESARLVRLMAADTTHYAQTDVIPFTTSHGNSAYHVWRLIKPFSTK